MTKGTDNKAIHMNLHSRHAQSYLLTTNNTMKHGYLTGRYWLKIYSTLAILFICASGFAQSLTAHGKVIDAKGDPLIGVYISVKETKQRAVSDINGDFSIGNVPQGSALIFNYIGYDKLEMKAATNMKVRLYETDKTLGEVVVIGYGTVKKRDLTGAVASVDRKSLIALPTSNLAEALQGKLAGVKVIMQDGRPGADNKIIVRGNTSISQSNEPLYIVDGFPVSTITDIPMDQIMSIDVLKDASSTAIYGARGANGVILVTTKGAESGPITVNYSGYYQTKWAAKRLKTISAQEYVKSVWGYAATPGTGGSADDIAKYYGLGAKYGNHYADYANVAAHDYTDDMLRTATTWNQSITLSGGNKKTKFSLGVNYNKDEGIKIRSDYENRNMDFKFFQRISTNMDMNMDLHYGRITINGNDKTYASIGSLLSEAYTFRPIDKPLGTDDYTLFDTGVNNVNPAQNPAMLTKSIYDNNAIERVRGNISLDWNIMKGLVLHTEYGYDKRWRNLKYYEDGSVTSSFTKGYKYAVWNKAESKKWRSVTTLRWNPKNIGENHDLSIMAGNEEIYYRDDQLTVSGAGYPTGDSWTRKRVFSMMNMGNAEKYPLENFYLPENGVAETTASFFFRIRYGYKSRYLLSASLRTDGSSKFAPKNHWGYFPAGAMAWRISEEPFMGKAQKWLDNLKLRLSIGMAGADHINSGMWHETWTSTNGVWNGKQVQFYTPSGQKENPNLKWESTLSRNIGLDFGMFKHITGTIDLYWNTTKDLLMKQEIDPSTGYSYQYNNIGQTSNKGLELALNINIIRKKDYNLNFNLTYNYNHNNIDKLYGGKAILYNSNWAEKYIKPGNDYILREGAPVGVVRGYKSDGFYTLDDFDYNNGVYTLKKGVPDIQSTVFTNYPKPAELQIPNGQSAFPGALKVKDMDKNGIVNEGDVVELGNIIARNTGGFGLSGNYKNIDFRLSFTFQLGGRIYNATAMNEYTGRKGQGIGRNKRDFIRNCFQLYDVRDGELVAVTDPEELAALNKNASRPVPYYEANTVLSEFIEDASFLKLSNVNIGYSLPNAFTKKLNIRSARIYVTANNVFCITKYTGLDPEVDTNCLSGSSGYPTPGLDFGSYPKSRSITLGINLTL